MRAEISLISWLFILFDKFPAVCDKEATFVTSYLLSCTSIYFNPGVYKIWRLCPRGRWEVCDETFYWKKGTFFLGTASCIYCTTRRKVDILVTKTCLYNFDPIKPHFYIVKLGFTGVYIIFHISAQNIDCGYSLEPPRFCSKHRLRVLVRTASARRF